MADIGPVAQTGAISTQVEAIQKPRVEAPVEKVQETPPPPPPPVDSGRGANIDTSA